MRLLIILICFFTIGKGYSQCGTPQVRMLTSTAPNEWFRGDISAYSPGDTLKFMNEFYSVIEFYGTSTGGNFSCPFVIVANTFFHANNIRFKGGAHNFKILSTGGGKDSTTFRSITANNVSCDDANHITVDGLKIFGASVGFYNKMNVSYGDRRSWFPAAPMTGNKLLNCWIDSIMGESVYSGLTQNSGYVVTSSWSGLDTTIVGNITDSTIIDNNLITNSLWDAIQLSHSAYGNRISNNTVINFGTGNISNQKAGIIMGGDCNGDVYGNIVKHGTGNGIEIFGFGSINVYDNEIDSVGTTDENPNGEESMYCVTHTVTYTSRPPLALYIHDNKINHPRLRGAIRNATNGNEIASLVRNNTFCIPNAQPNWQDTYLILDVPGTVNENNTLLCETPCNCTITNILRSGKYIN